MVLTTVASKWQLLLPENLKISGFATMRRRSVTFNSRGDHRIPFRLTPIITN
jgi:hypothetical protein